jgi:hypothetical protein
VKRYAELFDVGVEAARSYCQEVRTGAFPTEEHAFGRVRSESAPSEAPPPTTERLSDASSLVQAAILAAAKTGYGPRA